MRHASQHVGATNMQPVIDMLRPPGGSNTSSVKLMTRNVSWDPNIRVLQPETPRFEPRQQQKYPHTPSTAYRDRLPRISILHPILSFESTNLLYDARLSPVPTFPASMTYVMAEPATSSGARHLKLVSREFPWTIPVEKPKQHVVTCADVFDALYAGLSIPITLSEWSLADDYKKESMERANRIRRGGSSVKRLRRIDWLGSRVYFKGLSKDDDLCRSRLLPEDSLWPDTWVIKFGSRG